MIETDTHTNRENIEAHSYTTKEKKRQKQTLAQTEKGKS
jgi:hypothetical protein